MKGLALLLAANVETIVLLGAAWYGAQILESKYGSSFPWLWLSGGIAGMIVIWIWIKTMRMIVSGEAAQQINKKG